MTTIDLLKLGVYVDFGVKNPEIVENRIFFVLKFHGFLPKISIFLNNLDSTLEFILAVNNHSEGFYIFKFQKGQFFAGLF